VHPLLPYLLGRPHPAGRRLADRQKCLRTTDIDQVGDATHLTFFEMLGNWSLGAYFKRESITWSHELVTSDDLLAILPQRLWISVFAGNQATPADAESAGIWGDLGIPAERIVYLGEEHNWWASGPEGPCGPDTEGFGDTTGIACQRGDAGCLPGTCDCGRFVEVWNNVFMTFQRRGDHLLPRGEPAITNNDAGTQRAHARPQPDLTGRRRTPNTASDRRSSRSEAVL
jgi:alanyl-tRNA synthetase